MLGKAIAPVVTYGLTGTPDWGANGIRGTPEGGSAFTLLRKGKPAGEWRLSMTGRHNVLNALSVLAAADRLGVKPEIVQQALLSFQGVARRQDLVGTAGGISVYDDFAHHPTAIAETIDAIRMRHPGQRVIAVFEPRSNTSRRNIFQKEFPGAFGKAGLAFIAPVFNAEKLSDAERLDVPRVIRDICALGVQAETPAGVDAIVTRIAEVAKSGDVILVMSNGGFGGIHQKLLTALAR
jgi:UDP-N-acetylmuramate: L-alanyl-gamma-D-glutamyl-meso-diaminopimelate ligase